MGIGFQTGVDQPVTLRCAVDPDGGGDKALHQETLRRTNVGFVECHARFTQQLFIAHQLAMRAAIKPVHRLAVEIFQFQRRDAPAVFPAQYLARFFNMLFRDKGHGLLRRKCDVQRAVVRCQPEFHLGSLRSVPPVSGQ
ncbi:hypothetical protein D1872_291780 [compost metagenome]